MIPIPAWQLIGHKYLGWEIFCRSAYPMSSDQSLLPLKPPRWHRWPRWPAFQECTPRNQCPTESHGRWWLWWQMAGSQKAEKTILCVKILLDFFKTIHIYIYILLLRILIQFSTKELLRPLKVWTLLN